MRAVILTAGLGTRLLPATRGTPKEMLPLFAAGRGGKLCLKPVLQVIFEQLYDVGFREFCLVVSKGKKVVKDYFVPDEGLIDYLRGHGKGELANEMEEFYERVGDSSIVYVNQPEPKGTGDAVLRVRTFTVGEPFLLHMGDDIILSRDNLHIKRLMRVFDERNADAAFLATRVEDPRMYGVIVGQPVVRGLYKVASIVYRPKKPPSNLVDVAAYILKPDICVEIEKVQPDEESGETSLIPAIQRLIDQGGGVYALEIDGRRRLDIGTPELYWEALSITHKLYGVSRENEMLDA